MYVCILYRYIDTQESIPKPMAKKTPSDPTPPDAPNCVLGAGSQARRGILRWYIGIRSVDDDITVQVTV